MSGARITREDGIFRAEPWHGAPPKGGWRSVFALYAGDNPKVPPLLGTYDWDGGAVLFRPRFPPVVGVALRAVFQPLEGPVVTERFAGVPSPVQAPTTHVVSVTPSGPVWPENVLRFYVTFSAPMRIGSAWAHIRLRDEAGEVVPGAFVEIDQELWDPEGRRLTVLFDPARIKRGLVDHDAEGLPLVPGRAYTLEIDKAWRDAKGSPLREPFAKEVSAAEAERRPLDPAFWKILAPRHPDGAVAVDFGRPVDAALAARALSIWRGDTRLTGQVHMLAFEQRWQFQPTYLWASGRYELRAEAVLEDVAGNRIGRAFDIDAAAGEPREASGAKLPFTLKF